MSEILYASSTDEEIIAYAKQSYLPRVTMYLNQMYPGQPNRADVDFTVEPPKVSRYQFNLEDDSSKNSVFYDVNNKGGYLVKNASYWKKQQNKLQKEIAKNLMRECLWADEGDGYESSCGMSFVFNNGTANDNEFNFCPNCGKKLVDISGYDSEGGTNYE